MENWPKISVIIPVLNEEKFIAETLKMIRTQDYPEDKLEIIVADSLSDDATAEIVKGIMRNDFRIRLVKNHGRLSSSGRNVGIDNAIGEIITFVDGHTYIDNNQLLKNIACMMIENDLKVLSRPQFLDTPNNNFFQRAVSLARKSLIGHGLDSTIYTHEDKEVDPSSSGASYRRELFDEIGKYDENFDACEDVELNYRASINGYKSYTSKKLAVYYYPRDSSKSLFKQLKRYGMGRLRLARKHRSSISLSTLIPLMITIDFPLLGIAAIFSEWARYLFAATFIPYIGLILLWSLAISIKNGIKYFSILPVIFLTIHTALGWGFFVELFKKSPGPASDK